MELELGIVNFEQAKYLKELGFPQKVHPWHLYDIHTGILHKDYDDSSPLYLTENDTCMAPSLELVAKWLRDIEKLSITISWMPNIKKYSCICGDMNYIPKEHSYSESYKMYNEKFTVVKNGNYRFNSYEDALSAGIDKAIKILKGI